MSGYLLVVIRNKLHCHYKDSIRIVKGCSLNHSLSLRCTQDWKVASGTVLKVQIQFQLDRDRFCRCHYALDQLQRNQQLGLLFPNASEQFHINALHVDASFSDLNLDEEQVRNGSVLHL